MNNKIFYLKVLILILIFLNSVSFSMITKKDKDNLCFYENDTDYILVEKNIISKSFINYLYKNSENKYLSEIYDYNTNKLLELKDLIKENKIELYNQKINDLLYLKYPKFIADTLITQIGKKSYIFRDNELVIYFSNYKIEPEVDEVLYLKVNYNEIKDFLNFEVILTNTYQNENGYNYTNSKKSVAFTFDDGPTINKTNKIISYLKDNLSHATFFVVGDKSENNFDLLLNIKSSGNEIGSHTYSHKNIKKMSTKELIDDFNNMNNIYYELFHSSLKYLRPPYGSYQKSQLELLDVSFILWSMDTLDWKKRNTNYIVNYVLDNIKDGDIILFHDSYDTTVQAIKELLPLLYSRGYQIMSVSELAKLKEIEIENNKVYHSFN